jgi:Protein of unknown function (DUF1045)
MKDYSRYAIYWTPQPGSELARFGERWFAEPAQTAGLPADLAQRAVKAPARYGLHATLKAPFPLRVDASAKDVQQALDAFCAKRRAPIGGAFKPAFFQGFFGLVLSAHTADVDWLAASCVTHFDGFRDPRGTSGVPADGPLTPQEEAFEAEFGYPYILSVFQFHVTLAGPLPQHELDLVAAALQPHIAPFLHAPVLIDSLTLLGELAETRVFEPLSRHPFRWSSPML